MSRLTLDRPSGNRSIAYNFGSRAILFRSQIVLPVSALRVSPKLYVDVKHVRSTPIPGLERLLVEWPMARMTPETRPLCLHVYRIGGIWGDDKIIRAEDKKTPRYFLKGTRLATSWQFSLHVGGPNGMLVCQVMSPYLGPPMVETDPGPIRINFRSRRGRVVKVQRGRDVPYGAYSFQGLDENMYRWQPSSRIWGNKMECLNSQGEVVATYRITVLAISKDGELRIHQV